MYAYKAYNLQSNQTKLKKNHDLDVTLLFLYYYVGKPSHCLKIVVVSNINITTEKHQNQYHAKRLSEVCI